MRTSPFFLASVILLGALGCGGSDSAENEPLVPADGAADGTGEPDTTFTFDTPSGCVSGTACGDGGTGVCTADGTCCERYLACGGVCCSFGSVCSFGKCAVPGVVCVDATDCKDDEICDYSLGPAPSGDAGVDSGETGSSTCVGGAELKKGRCLPRPPRCTGSGGDAGPPSGDDITCLDKCEYRPPAGAFAPKLKFSWGDPAALNTRDSVMMTPIVVQLDDDNCDGVVDERDIPEIVFSTFASGQYTRDGTLRAISIVNKKVVEKWAVAPTTASAVNPGAHLAAGNIDGKAGNEVVACVRTAAGVSAAAYDGAGKVIWTSPTIGSCRVPNLADLDGDGTVEVITEGHVLNGATGAIKYTLATPTGAENTVADLDGDGVPEIVSPVKVWDNKGVVLADATATTVVNAIPGGNYVALGDFDKDGIPEVVTADSSRHMLHVWRYDAAAPGKVRVVRRNVDINGTLSPTLCPTGSAGSTRGGGPPTIADFNGDGTPDVAMAGGVAYGVYDGKKLLDPAVTNPTLWLKQTHDCSSAATGSSVFDFDGDGKAEVVYSDEWYLRIYSGTDGSVLFQTCNTTGTLTEYPVIADVDNDGHADIIVASNSYSSIVCGGTGTVKTAGVRVFGDTEGKWVRTRRIWNQHTYHVTNVLEDGTIPAKELPNWKQPRLNNFRQNVQPLGEFAAPDLIVTVRPSCEGVYALIARVRNIGEAAVEAPIDVGLYAGTTLLGKMTTTRTLYPAESEDLVFTFPTPPTGVGDGTTKVHAVVDDGMPMHPWHECRTDNNKSPEVSGRCTGPM